MENDDLNDRLTGVENSYLTISRCQAEQQCRLEACEAFAVAFLEVLDPRLLAPVAEKFDQALVRAMERFPHLPAEQRTWTEIQEAIRQARMRCQPQPPRVRG